MSEKQQEASIHESLTVTDERTVYKCRQVFTVELPAGSLSPVELAYLKRKAEIGAAIASRKYRWL